MSGLSDPDMQNVLPALIRASQQARKLAEQTGTEFVVIRNGKLVREIPKAEPTIEAPEGQQETK